MAPRKSTHRSQVRFKARVVSGAVAAAYPGFIEPQLASLRRQVPTGARWIRDWAKAGVWTRLFDVVSDDPDMEYAIVRARETDQSFASIIHLAAAVINSR